MENEVFCSKCKYIFRYEIGKVFISYNCKHPNNIKVIKEKNWFHKYTYEVEDRFPEDINKNNDCKWFKDKNEKNN